MKNKDIKTVHPLPVIDSVWMNQYKKHSLQEFTMIEVRQRIDLSTFLTGDFEIQCFRDQDDFDEYIEMVLDPQKLQYYPLIECRNGSVGIVEKWT